jgi:hypothetical protein
MIIEEDFYWSCGLYTNITIDYNRSYYCDEFGCDTKCYCSKITDIKITDISIPNIVDHIYSKYFDNSLETKRDNKINSIFGISKNIDIYTIDRVIRHYKLYNNENWDISVVKKYYGEEIEDVTIVKKVAKEIEEALNKAFSIINLKDRIEFLLKMEYGHILPELKDSTYDISLINKSDLIFPIKELDSSKFYSDSEYRGIRGLVTKQADKWRLVDGYHRCSSTKSDRILVIKSIPCRK